MSPEVRRLGAEITADERGAIMVIAHLRISTVSAMYGTSRPGRKSPLSQHLGERVMYMKQTVASRPRERLADIRVLFWLRNSNMKGIYGNCAS